jgi:hypothetical protein
VICRLIPSIYSSSVGLTLQIWFSFVNIAVQPSVLKCFSSWLSLSLVQALAAPGWPYRCGGNRRPLSIGRCFGVLPRVMCFPELLYFVVVFNCDIWWWQLTLAALHLRWGIQGSSQGVRSPRGTLVWRMLHPVSSIVDRTLLRFMLIASTGPRSRLHPIMKSLFLAVGSPCLHTVNIQPVSPSSPACEPCGSRAIAFACWMAELFGLVDLRLDCCK